MTANSGTSFDEKVSIDLQMDEAVVLLWYLSREVWNRGMARLDGTCLFLAMAFSGPH